MFVSPRKPEILVIKDTVVYVQLFIIMDNWPNESTVFTVCGHIDVCDEPIKNAGYLIFYWGVLNRPVYSTSNFPEKE